MCLGAFDPGMLRRAFELAPENVSACANAMSAVVETSRGPIRMPPSKTEEQATLARKTPAPVRKDRHARRVVFGLTGLLGAAWALVIASRFTGILAG